MSLKYEYDSNGVYFYYFLLSLLSLWVVPTTWFYLRNLVSPKKSLELECACPQSKKKAAIILQKNRRTLANPRLSKTFVFWVLGWFTFAFLLYKISTAEVVPDVVTFDPFQILGVALDSTEEEIKKAYKKLSLIWHPDKAEDKDLADIKFVEISKAYRSLTNEETKKNFEEFGNPDGKQQVQYGIALPTWIVDPSNKLFVLTAYTAIFMVLLPYLLSRWWTSSKNLTRDGVLNYTMGIYFQDLKEGFKTRRILELICASVEFKENVPWRGERDMEAIMALFRIVKDTVYAKTGDRLDLPKKYNQPYCFKAFVIAHAHLFRVPIDDNYLLEDSYIIIPKFVHLAQKGIMNITSAHFWLYEALSCMEISRMMIQAVPSPWSHTESSDLHQLPYFGADIIKAIRSKKKSVKNVESLLAVDMKERHQLLLEVGLSQDQVNDVLFVARRIPKITIQSAVFECKGEGNVNPGSLVTFVVTLKAVDFILEEKYYSEKVASQKLVKTSTKTSPLAVSKDVDASDSEDDDVESGKPSRLTKLLSGTYWDNPNSPVYCPYFPNFDLDSPKKPSYSLWLCNPKNNRVVGAPMVVNNLVPCSAYISEDDVRSGTKTVRMKFQAPNQVGIFQFSVVVQSDCYLGTELEQDVKLEVVKVLEDEEVQRSKTVKDAWKDLEEEESLEKDGLLGAQTAMMAQQNQLSKAAASDEDTDWESSGSEDEDDE